MRETPSIPNKLRLMTLRQRQACRKSGPPANACEKGLRRQLCNVLDGMGPAPPETMRAFDSRKRSPPSDERCSEARPLRGRKYRSWAAAYRRRQAVQPLEVHAPRSAKKPGHDAHAKNERLMDTRPLASFLSRPRRRHSFLSLSPLARFRPRAERLGTSQGVRTGEGRAV